MKWNPREWHHLYLGLALLAAGWLARSPVLVAVGWLVTTDDVIQHLVQTKRPEWKSPLHRLYGWVYARVPLIRKLNAWLDGLFQ